MIDWLEALHWGWWIAGIVTAWLLALWLILRALGWAARCDPPDEHQQRYEERIG